MPDPLQEQTVVETTKGQKRHKTPVQERQQDMKSLF
jgi:hypothetical protein